MVKNKRVIENPKQRSWPVVCIMLNVLGCHIEDELMIMNMSALYETLYLCDKSQGSLTS